MRNLNLILNASFSSAKNHAFEHEINNNSQKSRLWVEYLANGFAYHYPEHTVKCKDRFNQGHTSNELLADIIVAKFQDEISRVRKQPLNNLVEPSEFLWAIESEFNTSEREVNQDLSKLLMVTAQNKLYISSQVMDKQGFVYMMKKKVSSSDVGNYYLAIMEHPKNWKKEFQQVYVTRL